MSIKSYKMLLFVDKKFLTTKGKYCKILNVNGGDKNKKTDSARMATNKRN